MKMSELQNLDPARIGSWPLPVRSLLILGGCLALLFAGYWFDVKNQIADLERVTAEEQSLRDTFELKQRKAANLEPLKEQLAQMKQSFGEMLRLLPDKTEIEGLLVDISQAGLTSGLEFDLFKPGAEQPAEFYAIQPIRIKVTGTYHEFGEFISAVAALQRIVTQQEIAILPKGKPGASEAQDVLVMETVAKTYRYMDEDEIAENESQ